MNTERFKLYSETEIHAITSHLKEVIDAWQHAWLGASYVESAEAVSYCIAPLSQRALNEHALQDPYKEFSDTHYDHQCLSVDRNTVALLGKQLLKARVVDLECEALNRVIDDALMDLCHRLTMQEEERAQDAERLGSGYLSLHIEQASMTLDIVVAASTVLPWLTAAGIPVLQTVGSGLSDVDSVLSTRDVELSAQVGTVSMSRDEIESLSEGDVICLDQWVDEPVALRDGQGKALVIGTVGESDGAKAVQVL